MGVVLPLETYDWKNPDIAAVFRKRGEALARLRQNPKSLPAVMAYYRDNPAQFITDWGCTLDPRNVERKLPALIPFVLFPKQVEWVDFIMKNWRDGEYGLTDKSRDMGASWLAMGLSCTLCLFHKGMAIGFGSRKEEYVDRLGDPKSLLYKGRVFMRHLPVEFRNGWNPDKDAPHMRITFPATESIIAGEAGDGIGRGDRKGIYFVDEAAHLERPQLVEASLSMTTNCRQDLSSVNGPANPFAEKRHDGKHRVFTLHWRDDPRKDQAWYDKKVSELDVVTVAQEIDINYSASVEGVVIPSTWVQAAIDAHVRLGLKPSGDRMGALDVADEGKDKNAFCGAYGIVVDHIEEWSGVGGDIFTTAQKAFDLCDDLGYRGFRFDSDGLGAGVRGDARVINEQRKINKKPPLPVEPFRGSEGVFRPEAEDVKGRKNLDFFANRKAQAWWSLRERFRKTYRWVVENEPCDPDEIISISSKAGAYLKLVTELSQPTYGVNGVGKIVVDKAPDGMKSPNLADAVMIRFAPTTRKALSINRDLLAQA